MGWGGVVHVLLLTCIFFVPMSTIDGYWLSFGTPPVARGRCVRLAARATGSRSCTWCPAVMSQKLPLTTNGFTIRSHKEFGSSHGSTSDDARSCDCCVCRM